MYTDLHGFRAHSPPAALTMCMYTAGNDDQTQCNHVAT